MRAPWIDASSWWTTASLFCQQLSQVLALPDRQITVAPDGTAALEWLVENPCSLVLTDLRLPGISGLDLIREIRERELPVTVIVMTGYATVESAVEAMKLGAYDLILKPIDTIRLEVVVNQALEDRRLIDEVADLRGRLRKKYAYHNLLGRSPRMIEVFERVARVASSSCNVLVTGETGTGKELVAQAIHFSDVTRRGPLVAVNCAALPEHLLESELFGHERGAFTGADRQKKGRFELAAGGHALPRRDRRDAAGHAGQAAAGAPGRAVRARRRHRADPDRLPGHRRHQREPRRGRRRRAGSARTCSTGSTSSRSSCPRCASGWRTSRSWSTTSSRSWPSGTCPSRRSRDWRCRGCFATTGRATCASSSTSSSRRWSPPAAP